MPRTHVKITTAVSMYKLRRCIQVEIMAQYPRVNYGTVYYVYKLQPGIHV